MPVEGNAGSGNTDVGSPVKVGGKFNSTRPTLADGQRGDLQVSNKSVLLVALADGGSGTVASVAQADGNTNGSTGQVVTSFGYLFNGASWDRARTPNVFKPINAVAIGSEATIWTPGAGKKFRLMGFYFVASAAVLVTLKDNTAGTTILIATAPLSTTGLPGVSPPMGNGILSAAANNVLTATGSGAANLSGFVFGTEE